MPPHRLQLAGYVDACDVMNKIQYDSALPYALLTSVQLVGPSQARVLVVLLNNNHDTVADPKGASLVVMVNVETLGRVAFHSSRTLDDEGWLDGEEVVADVQLDSGFDAPGGVGGRLGLFQVAVAVLDGGRERMGCEEVAFWPVFCHAAEGVVSGLGGSVDVAYYARIVSVCMCELMMMDG